MQLTDIPSITPELAKALTANNYWTVAKLAEANPDELNALALKPRLTKKLAREIIEQAKTLAATEAAAGKVKVTGYSGPTRPGAIGEVHYQPGQPVTESARVARIKKYLEETEGGPSPV